MRVCTDAERFGGRRKTNGKWRSLAARCVRDAEVGGSNPPFPTTETDVLRVTGVAKNGPSLTSGDLD